MRARKWGPEAWQGESKAEPGLQGGRAAPGALAAGDWVAAHCLGQAQTSWDPVGQSGQALAPDPH